MLFLYQMETVETEIVSDILTCGSCGKEFSCGAKTGKCWCFEVEADAEKLEELREEFQNCLCRACLDIYGKKEK